MCEHFQFLAIKNMHIICKVEGKAFECFGLCAGLFQQTVRCVYITDTRRRFISCCVYDMVPACCVNTTPLECMADVTQAFRLQKSKTLSQALPPPDG